MKSKIKKVKIGKIEESTMEEGSVLINCKLDEKVTYCSKRKYGKYPAQYTTIYPRKIFNRQIELKPLLPRIKIKGD